MVSENQPWLDIMDLEQEGTPEVISISGVTHSDLENLKSTLSILYCILMYLKKIS